MEPFGARGSVGVEWLVDARGCASTPLGDLEVIGDLLRRVIRDLDLNVVGEGALHRFPPPGGVTALYLLRESHLACHTYPELGVATFNLYCCRPRREWPWRRELRERLGAGEIVVRSQERGQGGAAAAGSERRGALEAHAGAGRRVRRNAGR